MMSVATATATSAAASTASILPPPPVLSNGDGESGALRRKLPEQGVMDHGSEHNEDNEHQSSSGDPLSPELRRVLMEVARTGHCSWLSWNTIDGGVPASSSSAEGAAAASVSNSNKNATASGGHFLTHSQNRTPSASSSPYHSSAAPSQSSPLHKVPPRKKRRRNGLHGSMGRRRAFASSSESSSRAKSPAAGNSVSATRRKRPLILIRTTSTSTTSSIAGSVGSGRTSGSEVDDSTHYECDSEGTSATTNSELSMDRTREQQQLRQRIAIQKKQSSVTASSLGEKLVTTSRFRTLQEAVRVALALVLDHSYRTRGGYKLSPAELRRNNDNGAGGKEPMGKGQTETESASNSVAKDEPNKSTSVSPEAAFQLRRRRLLALLGEDDIQDEGQNSASAGNKTHALDAGSKGGVTKNRTRCFPGHHLDGPPFTLQRVAEVLVSPERYYTQTHKLCNCLEKLLLVSSPSNAFGGTAGGKTERSRQEERELAALAYEKGRERRLRRHSVASSDEGTLESHDSSVGAREDDHGRASPAGTTYSDDAATGNADHYPSSPDKADDAEVSHEAVVDAAARASLRSKFDHAAIDAHAASAAASADARAIAGQRGMTSSPPPPNLPLSVQSQFGSHQVCDSFSDPMAHHHPIVRPPSPPLFSSGTDSGTPVNPLSPKSNMHLLQVHNAPALAGMPAVGRTPLDILIGTSTSAAVAAADKADLEVEPGRSSASNSDVDSESDDFLLDDSASDRSDGSDSGIGSGTAHFEPFTAARLMTLNRIQQQQRLQSRQPFPSAGSHYQPGDTFRPPADSEYQSGDSIDSTRAEDSGGSDSSSSDVAD